MSDVYTEVLDTVLRIVESVSPLPVYAGALPVDKSVCVAMGAGGVERTDLNMGGAHACALVINAKDTDMRGTLALLGRIHDTLTRTKEYPTGENWQIYSIRTVGAPTLIDREADDTWLCGSSVRVYFYKGGIRS